MNNFEIERKFLVNKNQWLSLHKPLGLLYIQGYLSIDMEKVVRVRVASNKGFLTIKGNSNTCSHPEYEYEIPVADALVLLEKYTKRKVVKHRYRIPHGNHIWEVDVFEEENAGLIIAEIELNDAEEIFELPEWVGEEVTTDQRYYNANLSVLPYTKW